MATNIANPLTITLGGSGGTAKALKKINQDSYGSEYYLRESTQEFTVKIRHSREPVKNGALPLERHNLEITQTVFATDPSEPDTIRQVYVVIRSNKADTASDVVDVGEAMAYFLNGDTLTDLNGWVN